MRASIFAGLWLVHVCLCTLKGRPVETRQKVARLREHNNNNLKHKLPVERKPPEPEPEPEPESTAATTETRTNVKIRKLCSPDMLSNSRTAPRFCVRININSANVTPRRALVRKLENFTGVRRYRSVKCLVVLRKCVVSERPFYFRPMICANCAIASCWLQSLSVLQEHVLQIFERPTSTGATNRQNLHEKFLAVRQEI